MRLRKNGMLSRGVCKVQIQAGTLRGWLFLWLVLSVGLAVPAQAGLLDRLTGKDAGVEGIEISCRKGDASRCISTGNIYRYGKRFGQKGTKVAKDVDKAIELYRLGCLGGDRRSCHALYQIGFDDSRGKRTKVNIARAAQLFTAACEGSASGKYSGRACHELAKLHLKGKGVPKNVPHGVELLQRGCDRFSRQACRDLGNILLEGSLVSKDVPGGVAALGKGCEGKKKDPQACARLGMLFSKGEQVKRDLSAAEIYLTEGCTFPNRVGTACHELARLYETELSGRKSEEEISELYRIACDRADLKRVGAACAAAAERHLQGKGVKKDRNAAIHLYNRGCMLKHRESCRRSCEWNCEEGQPHACAAVKSGKYPLGVSNCFRP